MSRPMKQRQATRPPVVERNLPPECRKKRRYATMLQAERVVRLMRRLGTDGRHADGRPADPDTLNSYHCKLCGEWHVGHDGQKGDR